MLVKGLENIQVINTRFDGFMDCYKFNGGKNAALQDTPVLRSKKFGKYSGLEITTNISIIT